MKCLYCGSTLTDSVFCNNCGADIKIYKKIIRLSNTCYNEGLEKARVRDLSGAVDSLKKSLKFYKNNIEARNLLGLVYYEMGEVVSALSEWVLCKNIQSKNNIAGDYIKAIQSNPGKLDSINLTIKKYNQALGYCRQQSEDLAIIQLKKVLSLNPNFVQAHQLLGLLYLQNGEYLKGKKTLKKALSIDGTNTTTLRYLNEIESRGPETEEVKSKKQEDHISYKSGNETIIQPTVFRDNSGLQTVINVVIGLIIGAALVWFLVVPTIKQSVKSQSAKDVVDYSDQIAAKNTQISSLEKEVAAAKKTADDASKKLNDNDDKSVSYEKLIAAYQAQQDNDLVAAAEELKSVNTDVLTADMKTLYNQINSKSSGVAATQLYNDGNKAYKSRDYETAIDLLSQAVGVDPDVSNGDGLYTLGRAYQKSGDQAKANEIFQQVIDKYPGTKKENNAKANMVE